MKVQARPAKGKVEVSLFCGGCSGGFHDVLRPCPTCGRTPAEKRDLRAMTVGTDRALDALLFTTPGGEEAGRP